MPELSVICGRNSIRHHARLDTWRAIGFGASYSQALAALTEQGRPQHPSEWPLNTRHIESNIMLIRIIRHWLASLFKGEGQPTGYQGSQLIPPPDKENIHD